MPTSKRRNVVIGDKTWGRLKDLAKKEERSMSDIIREGLMELFKQREAGVERKPEYDPVTDTFQKKKDL